MLIDECILPNSNRLVDDYVHSKGEAGNFFEYDYKNRDTYVQRRNELVKNDFPRRKLVNHLLAFNEQFSTHPKVFENIQKLEANDCTVVITGQQAGLLTGPLYTIYKAITTIQLAKAYEGQLKTPVVPIFWAAGEDHDYQEINHIWVEKDGKVIKKKYPNKQVDKQPVSDIPLDQDSMEKWVEEIFSFFGESPHTAEMMKFLKEKIYVSKTISDFFIHVMSHFFQKYGLIFFDSNQEEARKIEAAFFEEMIRKTNELQAALKEQESLMGKLDYETIIETDAECAHLFYHLNGERELLHKNQDNMFYLKEKDRQFTEEELVNISKESPELLSNNVVTRPLMQDFLFPTLAFVAGPGEITYWAQLKLLFDVMNRKMPPIVPRMNLTVVERKINKMLEQFDLSVENILTSGVETFRNQWLESRKNNELESIIQETRDMIDLAHSKLRKFAWENDRNLGKLSEKNRLFIMSQIDFMEMKIERMYKERYLNELHAFDTIEASLVPNGGMQERSWNIFYFLNKYGLSFIDELFTIHGLENDKHHIIYI